MDRDRSWHPALTSENPTPLISPMQEETEGGHSWSSSLIKSQRGDRRWQLCRPANPKKAGYPQVRKESWPSAVKGHGTLREWSYPD